MMDDLTQLKVDVDGHVALLTMDNPPVNALSRVLNDELTLALDRISEIDDIRVVVLTGAGKVFCAGADLKGRAPRHPGRRRLLGPFAPHPRVLSCDPRVREACHRGDKRSGARLWACNGCLGGRFDRFGEGFTRIAEVDVGLLGGCRHAMRLFGHSRTRRMMLTGYRVPRRRAVQLGVVKRAQARKS